MTSSLVSTSEGSSGVQSTSPARTLSPPSERDPLAMASSALRTPVPSRTVLFRGFYMEMEACMGTKSTFKI